MSNQANVATEALAKPNQIVICKFVGCHDIATTQSFCRFHYLSSWKKLKSKEAKKKGKELEAYIEEMSSKFPEDFFQKLRADLEEMAEKEALAENEEATDKGSLFDHLDDDADLETIIHGLKVEDF